MLVRVKLFATLGRFRPGERPGSPFTFAVDEGATVADLTARLGLPEAEVKVVFVNGLVQPPTYVLRAADEVGIFPPIGGG